MTDSSLLFHEFEDCLWIRCTGRGCFMNSPALKAIADKYLDGGGGAVVVDLELCPGVDSTFMGTLAGIARRCMAAGGALQVAAPTARTRAAMEGLGLDMLLELDPPDAPWQSELAERRAALNTGGDAAAAPALNEVERTRHVLDAHTTLREMSKQNEAAFSYVCDTLKEDLERHEQDADGAQK